MTPKSLILSAVAIVLLLVVAVLAWPSRRAQAPADAFASWRAAHRQDVDAYRGFLVRHGVWGVLPEPELLRRGRRWQACGGQRFAVPPRELWPSAVPTLRLLRDLRAAGLLDGARAVSAYRSADFNRCEGGSARSRHLQNQAFDLEWSTGSAPVAPLCAAWRRQGRSRAWGLGFYTPSRIHVDTAGYRTWGSDYHAATSLCLRPAARPDRLESVRLPTP